VYSFVKQQGIASFYNGLIMSKTIALVSGIPPQFENAMPARWLYHSEWFLVAAALAETASTGWFILSARYGLLHPDQKIAPYELTLSDLAPDQRHAWAEGVLQSLTQILKPGDRLLLLAEPNYHTVLYAILENSNWRLAAPLHGMPAASQVVWMQNAIDHPVQHPTIKSTSSSDTIPIR